MRNLESAMACDPPRLHVDYQTEIEHTKQKCRHVHPASADKSEGLYMTIYGNIWLYIYIYIYMCIAICGYILYMQTAYTGLLAITTFVVVPSGGPSGNLLEASRTNVK